MPELLGRVEDDQELLAELLALFQEDLPTSRAALQEAVAQGELHEIERTAHALKGMLANLSAKHTAALAAAIESAARAGDSPKIPELISAFNPEINAFSAALDSFMASAER